ncbi:glyoxalase [Metabacillus herbersteinensis]|uniref:Glyoxalase n=1 Tax=Metabacillus herbersteinensis TaxID=283816 RepID=A0ABV6GAL3_9BACI
MTITILKLDHIQLCVPIGEEPMARQFYLNILKFQEIEKPESLKSNGGFWCQAGDVQLHIGVEKMQETLSKRHPAFLVENVAITRTYLENHAVKTQDEKPVPGVKRFSCFDPFNNRIEFLE